MENEEVAVVTKPLTELRANYVLCFILGVVATLLVQRWSMPDAYFTGPRGGCYYIERNGEKTYVDRSYCQKRAE